MENNETIRIFDYIWGKVVEITDSYNVYDCFFMKKQSLKILNEFNYGIFEVLKKSLARDLMRLIFTLLDPIGKGKKKNIGFRYLEESIKKEPFYCNNPNKKELFENRFNELYELSKSIKEYRNKALAHNDLNQNFPSSKDEEKIFIFSWYNLTKIITLMQKIISNISQSRKSNTDLGFRSTNVLPDAFIENLAMRSKKNLYKMRK